MFYLLFAFPLGRPKGGWWDLYGVFFTAEDLQRAIDALPEDHDWSTTTLNVLESVPGSPKFNLIAQTQDRIGRQRRTEWFRKEETKQQEH